MFKYLKQTNKQTNKLNKANYQHSTKGLLGKLVFPFCFRRIQKLVTVIRRYLVIIRHESELINV